MPDFVGAVDQGTTSSRFMIFDHSGNEVAKHQLEHEQILPQAGWVEHNPVEIWERTASVIQTALNGAGLRAGRDSRELARSQQAEARAPQQHVADAARLLVAGSEHSLGEHVREPGDDRL